MITVNNKHSFFKLACLRTSWHKHEVLKPESSKKSLTKYSRGLKLTFIKSPSFTKLTLLNHCHYEVINSVTHWLSLI